MKLYKCRPRNFCFHYIFEINLVKFSHSFMHRDECGHFSLFQAQSSRHSQCIQNIFFSEMMALDVLWKRYIPNYLFLNQVYMKKAVFFWHISRYIYISNIFEVFSAEPLQTWRVWQRMLYFFRSICKDQMFQKQSVLKAY